MQSIGVGAVGFCWRSGIGMVGLWRCISLVEKGRGMRSLELTGNAAISKIHPQRDRTGLTSHFGPIKPQSFRLAKIPWAHLNRKSMLEALLKDKQLVYKVTSYDEFHS